MLAAVLDVGVPTGFERAKRRVGESGALRMAAQSSSQRSTSLQLYRRKWGIREPDLRPAAVENGTLELACDPQPKLYMPFEEDVSPLVFAARPGGCKSSSR